MIDVGVGGDGVLAHWARAAPPDSRVLERMATASPHRGSVLRKIDHGHMSFGVTGRSTPRGLGQSRAVVVAFAGTIDSIDADNPQLLQTDGDQIATAIAKAIGNLGFSDVISRLRGAFSLIAGDGTSMYCVRDHIGFSSLFYRKDSSEVFVASEAKQVVAGAQIRREPNLEVIEQIFFGMADLDMPSALAGVSRVPRHHSLRFSAGGTVRDAIFEPEALLERSFLGIDDVSDAFHALMDQAVRRVMRGPDALALSGGVDSPAVAAYAAPAHREMFGTPLAAMSNVYPNHPFVDESKYIEPVASLYGMPLQTIEPTARPTDGLADWVRLLDGPFPVVSIAESAELYQWVQTSGFDVLLTGEFAEFVFDASSHVLSHFVSRGDVPAAVHNLQARRARGSSRGMVARQLLKAVTPPAINRAYRRYKGLPVSAVRPPWINYGPEPPQFTDVPLRRKWREEQLSFFGGTGVLLEVHDILQSRYRLRVRQPWADLDLWKFFLGLRAGVKHAYPEAKGLQRRLLRGRVPDLILDRRDKTVFDDNLRSKIDRAALAHWLISPRVKLPWIDYGLLADSIAKTDLHLREFMWMKDLAGVHAFLETW